MISKYFITIPTLTQNGVYPIPVYLLNDVQYASATSKDLPQFSS